MSFITAPIKGVITVFKHLPLKYKVIIVAIIVFVLAAAFGKSTKK